MTEEDPVKRAFETLLREYAGNSGMAGFVCGRPVELMPQSEQDRLINGFCTKQNIKILADSRLKLQEAPSLDLTEAQQDRAKKALPVLDDLVEVLTLFTDSKISVNELRERVREVLRKPVPENKEGLIEEVSKLIEMANFLAEQDLSKKDNWDRMLDCVQMHDALSRMNEICTALQTHINQDQEVASQSGALESSIELSKGSIEFLEAFFKGEDKQNLLEDHFKEISKALSDLWVD